MPEMAEPPMGVLEGLLKDKQGCNLSTMDCEGIVKALESDNNIKPQVIEKLLDVCIQDPRDIMKSAVDTLNIVSAVLKIVKAESFTSKPDLLPSMLKILHMIKITLYGCKSSDIKILYFEALLSYPDEVYVQLEDSHCNEVLELLNLYFHQRIPIEIRIQTINILHKYLKVLPPDKRTKFVKEGIDTLFLKLIPNVMVFTSTPNIKLETSIETLELVANELLSMDYFDNPNWDIVLQCLCTPKKYPALMTSLLEKGSDFWHRLWTVFIKILKSQITKSTNNLGSPINSMLSVVETAFKMDVTNRCRAFYCWKVLIDNFSSETNEVYINKRLKLLLIPLCANNAKFEEIAIAKLHTWWHLIYCFHRKLTKFSEIILNPFLDFCFGKQNVGNKPVFVPGLISESTKEHCMEAFVNILGHQKCDCPVTLPRLDDKLVTTKNLIEKWKDWKFYLASAIKHTAKNNKLNQNLKCAWITFVKIVCELPDNVKNVSFNELLSMLEELIQDCNDESLCDIVLNDLILPLFDGVIEVNELLKTRDENSSFRKIVTIMLNPSLDVSYNRNSMSDEVEKLKPFANFIIEHYLDTIEDLLSELPKKITSLVLWTALTAKICENKNDISAQILYKMILWPLQHMDLFSNVEYSTSLWHDMNRFAQTKCSTSPIEDEILNKLMNFKNINVTNSRFLLKASNMLLKHKVTSDSEIKCEKELDLLQYIMSKIHGLGLINIHVEFQTSVEVITCILKDLSNCMNINLAKQVLSTLKIVFQLLLFEFKGNKQIQAEVLFKIRDLLESIEKIFKVDAYSSLKDIISNELIEFTPHLSQNQTLKDTVVATLRTIVKNMDDSSTKNIKNAIDSVEHAKKSTESKFTTPGKVIDKKVKKKEASIVNTVVENGEEFVVVKSNWKFNPRKLTDNQKEKFRRKREDIPALYQDLSQSQDEFKLNVWKTDSQDTTTSSKSSSKSNDVTTNNVVSSILKNMPNTDFVPKILKDILTGHNKDNLSPEMKNENINRSQSPINKEVKTPRLALKDRVFRNVRNLIEKSSIQNDDKEEKGVVIDVMKTPVEQKIKSTNAIINSAPAESNLERPSRLKRKPKKFEDLQVFSLKKRRHSLGNSSSQNSDSDTDQINDPKNSELEKPDEASSVSLFKNLENLNNPPTQENTPVLEDTTTCSVKDLQNGNTEKDKISDMGPSNNDIEKNVCHLIDANMKQAIVVIDNIKDKIDSNLKNNEQSEIKQDNSKQISSIKKTGSRKSRIEKQLTIDMVEGHPLLKEQTPKRHTRKNSLETPIVSKRRSLMQKLNKSKTDKKNTPKIDKQSKETDEAVKKKTDKSMDTFPNSQDSNKSQDLSGSQDIIESSQDSTVSIMSTKSPKITKRVPVITLENIELKGLCDKSKQATKSIQAPHKETVNDVVVSDSEIKDCSGFPLNKTAADHVQIDLTENIYTEPMGSIITSDEIIEIADTEEPPIVTNKDDTFVEMDTQDIAEADTQLADSSVVTNKSNVISKLAQDTPSLNSETNKVLEIDTSSNNIDSHVPTQDESTKSLTESLLSEQVGESSSTLSFKEDEQRKQDFLNNTIEISPIKTLSPVRGDKSPTPETSNDYVVIKLSSPVQSNGEPCEKCDSPEIFTEDKVSPDKRDQSPLREQAHVTNASPKSLSLKRNKPKVRTGGRAAQMLGLCVPVTDRLQTILNTEKPAESEETKKCSPLNTSAKRNLRILYNSTNESSSTSEENEESENFLKLKRTLPSADSSPSVPILKRKLADIADDNTVSPASKRKRVSFHDPPVSTTICVKKYIEPLGVRSPQNSVAKRQERQLRAQLCVNLKSQKRLDTVFKLDTALTKAVEGFSDSEVTPNTNEDTENSSMEPTPLAEVVKNSELNDVDPICVDLINCNDPIDNIAGDLSSPAMKPLLVKEFAGKIETVGDLAKMTELEVNRLCIKAPKVQITRKVLTEYAKKLKDGASEITPTLEAALNESSMRESKSVDIEMQTECVTTDSIEVQTETLPTSIGSTQTDKVSTVDCVVQTDESGTKTTADIVKSLIEKPDFCERLTEQLDNPSKQSIAEDLPPRDLMDIVVRKLSLKKPDSALIDKIIEHHELNSLDDKLRLSCIRDYLSQQFTSKDLILFCSDLLKKVHDQHV